MTLFEAETAIHLPDPHTATVRPLEATDEALYPDFLAHVSAEDRRFRFFSAAELTARQIFDFTHYDPAGAIALVAESVPEGAILGVARLHRLSGRQSRQGEFAVLVRSDLKGQGLGRALMEELFVRAGSIGVDAIHGLVLSENVGMLRFAQDLGFDLTPDPDDPALVQARAKVGRLAGPG
ncbi:GNAT family N-acetyltransferase [uncultured Enterovirga sp.]|uniref:GNAT family N-acetyltransferase n=1 Tax=uncultured Enterovirga sp. TaxID=2026352 RepID=UPI0035CC45CD